MNGRRLLLDAGNTRLKWVVVEDGLWRDEGAAEYDDLSCLLPLLRSGTDCAVASVTAAAHETAIRTLLARAGIFPRWLVAEASFAEVTNGYVEPGQLGVDRWMALIAARRRSRAATLVVSVGTALTADALTAGGAFLGGIIAPGVSLMQQVIANGTARGAAADGVRQDFPRSTADAVQSGIVAALCGAIQVQYAHLGRISGGVPLCLLTGGDAARLLPHLSIAAEHVPALVLEGMDCVTRGSMS